MSHVGQQQAENQRNGAEMIPSLGEHHNMSVDEARLNGTQIKRQSSKLHRRSQTTHEQMHAPAAMQHMTYEQNPTHQSKLMDPAAMARNHNNSHFEGQFMNETSMDERRLSEGNAQMKKGGDSVLFGEPKQPQVNNKIIINQQHYFTDSIKIYQNQNAQQAPGTGNQRSPNSS